MTPREHHRFFAKQLIPTHTFQSPDKMFAGLNPNEAAFIALARSPEGPCVFFLERTRDDAGTGVAVGRWFIPPANFVLAPLSVRSAWKATVGAGGTLIAFGWWFLWLLEVVLEVVLESFRNTPELLSNVPRAAMDIVRRVNERL